MRSSDFLNSFFGEALSASLNGKTEIESFELLGGGDINRAARLKSSAGDFFIKWNENSPLGMFETEAKGLQILGKCGQISIPLVIGFGKANNLDFLVLEYIRSGRSIQNFWQDFGASLAAIHRQSQSSFGLEFDNYIGSLPQKNIPEQKGIEFFIQHRLRVQVQLAIEKKRFGDGLLDDFERLYEKLPDILPDEQPALLHGDLWSGNFLVNSFGKVSLIDPAVYYGLREAEISFTRLFGGFNDLFYEAYSQAFPLAPGFEQRIEIYNLYPLLVHLNLFGSGYLSSILRVLKKYTE